MPAQSINQNNQHQGICNKLAITVGVTFAFGISAGLIINAYEQCRNGDFVARTVSIAVMAAWTIGVAPLVYCACYRANQRATMYSNPPANPIENPLAVTDSHTVIPGSEAGVALVSSI